MQPERALIRPVVWLLSVTLALVSLFVAAPADADGTPTGRITGLVTGPGGTPISNVTVEVVSIFSGSWSLVGSTSTGPDGRYEYDDALEFVPHLLRFRHPDYVPEFYDNAATAATATIVQVTGGGTSVANAELADAGRITGTVTGTGGVGVPDAGVSAWQLVGSDWVSTGQATRTVDDGKYILSELPVGEYRLQFEGPSGSGYSSEWWDDAWTVETATTVQVTAGATSSGKNAQLSTAPPPAPAVVNAAPPTINGTAQVGAAVTATPGTWAPAGTSPAYQWLVAGSPVAAATTASYTPVAADAGKSLEVRVTASRPGFTAANATSTAITVREGTLKATKKPKVSGKAKKSATLKVSPGTWSPTKVAVTYKWYAGTKAIPKATSAKLKLAGKTLKTVAGKAISVLVTVSAPGYGTVGTVPTKLKVPGKAKR
jgi:5-hydroxyisourate hydrolase-like protein (transthyretin family)